MIPVRPRAVTITIDEAREVSGLQQVPPGAHVCCSARCCKPLRQQLSSAKRDRDFGFSRHNSEGLPRVLPGGETELATAPLSGVPWIPDITWGQGQFASRQALRGSDSRRQQCLRVLGRDALIASLKILND